MTTQTLRTIEEMTSNIVQEIQVRASLETTFAALLEEIGPANCTPEGVAMPMTIEPWPGGRWFRDLGNNNGHFWAIVQAIKKPTLLDLPVRSSRLTPQFPTFSTVSKSTMAAL
jgi:hypothetical protein